MFTQKHQNEIPQKHQTKCHKNTKQNTTKIPNKTSQKHQTKYHKSTKRLAEFKSNQYLCNKSYNKRYGIPQKNS